MEIEGRKRVVIRGVSPEVEGGRYPAKRVVGEDVRVSADIFTDGHDVLSCRLLFRKAGDPSFTEIPMEPLVNDRWQAAFAIETQTTYVYTLMAWVDQFKTWRANLAKKVNAGQDVSVELLAGADLIDLTALEATGEDAERLVQTAHYLRTETDYEKKVSDVLGGWLAELMDRNADRTFATRYGKELTVAVDRPRAAFGAWYELFPRSLTGEDRPHGTFKDLEARLPYIASMGFDVLYLPPIHPIGHTNRKGKNNAPGATPEDVGSPWAIGAESGGHTAIHPALGTLEDFGNLRDRASDYGIELALDIAFQCSPDHPYVKTHPEWFRWRPDGTVQYAENPPKKYEDIFPINFESDAWQELWQELKQVILFWISQGIRIFRVDNPHTKPFAFWEWVIREIRRDYPDTLFLSEAFTRPKVMYHLAKIGFTQSYTYFTWRNTKWELTQYFNELYQTDVREFFRPNLWPNTPDILTEYLQMGGRPAFITRLVLAATLSANYGIYGPAFELMENRAREFGSEEYLDSEKYQIRRWNIDDPSSLKPVISRLNRVRRENPALQLCRNLVFIPVDNADLIAYARYTDDLENIIVVVVNLSPHYTHAGWLDLPLEKLKIDPQGSFQAHDLVSDAHFIWHGHRNYVELNPHIMPAHVFRIRRKVRTEHDFDYFM